MIMYNFSYCALQKSEKIYIFWGGGLVGWLRSLDKWGPDKWGSTVITLEESAMPNLLLKVASAC